MCSPYLFWSPRLQAPDPPFPQTETFPQTLSARRYPARRQIPPDPVSVHKVLQDPVRSLLPHRAPLSLSYSIPVRLICSVSASLHPRRHISGSALTALRGYISFHHLHILF